MAYSTREDEIIYDFGMPYPFPKPKEKSKYFESAESYKERIKNIIDMRKQDYR